MRGNFTLPVLGLGFEFANQLFVLCEVLRVPEQIATLFLYLAPFSLFVSRHLSTAR